MNDHDPILAKVRKLLALAEDPAATTHEAETYTDKATQLIADYPVGRDDGVVEVGPRLRETGSGKG